MFQSRYSTSATADSVAAGSRTSIMSPTGCFTGSHQRHTVRPGQWQSPGWSAAAFNDCPLWTAPCPCCYWLNICAAMCCMRHPQVKFLAQQCTAIWRPHQGRNLQQPHCACSSSQCALKGLQLCHAASKAYMPHQ